MGNYWLWSYSFFLVVASRFSRDGLRSPICRLYEPEALNLPSPKRLPSARLLEAGFVQAGK